MTSDEVAATNTGDLPSYDWDQAAAQISAWNDKWDDEDDANGNALGTPGTVSYGYILDSGNSQYPALSAGEIESVELAFAMWEDVANISFVRVSDADSAYIADSGSAEMIVQGYADTNGGWMSGSRYGGTFYSSTLALGELDLEETGTWAFATAIHEIGHGIGMPHPGAYNGTVTEEQKVYFEDSKQFTVMSYFDETDTGAQFGNGWYWENEWVRGAWAPTGPMLHDIAAAQRLYGANMETRTGDSVYGWNSNLDNSIWSVTDWKDVPIAAIWDAGGIDTIDASGWRVNQTIDLREESFSSIGAYEFGDTPMINNVAIARGAVIENGIGGSGDDAIIGNAASNRLDGGDGDDTLTGGAGIDTFVFNSGEDSITDFEAGIDLIDISGFGSLTASFTELNGDTVITIGSDRLIVIGANSGAVQAAAGLAPETSDFAGALDDYEIAFAPDGLSLIFTNTNPGNGDPAETVLGSGASEIGFAGSVTANLTATPEGVITAFLASGPDGEILQNLTRDADGRVIDLRYEGGVMSSQQILETNGDVLNRVYDNGMVSLNILTEADGDVLTKTYDAAGQRETFTFEDGSGTQTWDRYTNTYGSNGERTAFDMVYDDGAVLNRSYDNGVTVHNVLTETDGDVITRTFNAAGKRDTFTFEDGSDNRSWERYTNTYDESGARTAYDVLYDNGNARSRAYDNGVMTMNVFTEADGDVITSTYNAAGQRETLVFEDGSDSRSWASYTNIYDEDGAFVSREFVWDMV